MIMMNDAAVSAYAVSDDLIEGGWTWQSETNKLWHARKKGSEPPLVVHGNNPEDLKESVRQA
jgi:hypothetical protein